MLTRLLDATRINEIVNDPSVRPHVQWPGDAAIDLTDLVADPGNFLLMGEHGGVLLIRLQNGLYEAHTMILVEGRGTWAVRLVRAVATYMFTKTDALELVTRTPTLKARALTKLAGGVLDCAVIGHDGKEVDIYRLTLQGWASRAEELAPMGAEVAQLLAFPDYGPLAHRPLGMLRAMFAGGQLIKGCIFFSRWALMARHDTASIFSIRPASFSIRDSVVVCRDTGEIYSASGPRH